MAPLGGLLCCCDCRRLIPFRLWPWGQRAGGRPGTGRGRQDEDEPALFAASTGTALHHDTAGTSNKPAPSITTTTCPQLQLPTFDQDQELFPSIDCSAPATVEPAHSAGGAAAGAKEEEEPTAVDPSSPVDSSPKTSESEHSDRRNNKSPSQSNFPLRPPPAVRFDELVTNISPLTSSTNLAGQNEAKAVTPPRARISIKPLSPPAEVTGNEEEGLTDFDFDWEARRASIRARSLKNRLRRTLDAYSLSNMASEADRAESLSSLKSLVSTLRKAGSTHSNNSSKSENSENANGQASDNLPEDRAGLEAQLNIHLGRLDRLRNQVRLFNDLIKDYYDLLDTQARIHAKLPEVEKTVLEELDNIRQMRAAFEKSVKFHHGKIDQIAVARARLDKSQGLKCTVWDMYMGFKKEAEWAQLFAF
ncbi:hypothetical protein ABEF95_008157 [Exophiala dermatitidis]